MTTVCLILKLHFQAIASDMKEIDRVYDLGRWAIEDMYGQL